MTTTDDALARLGSLVLDTGDRWGDIATEWQIEDARAILSRDPAAPRKHFQTRPRGGSKTTDQAGIGITMLIEQAPPGSRCYVVAADKDQARLLLDAAEGMIARTPGLTRILKVEALKITNISTGATLEVLAADGASTWGLRPYFTIVDEIANHPETRNARRVWEGLISAHPKVPDGRLVAMTSAGEPSHWAHRVREQALKLPGWRVSEIPGPVPWLNEADLAELRDELVTPSAYDRLVLNIWTDAEDRLTTREAVLECVGHEGRIAPEPGTGYFIGVDLGISNDATVIVVAHPELVEIRRPEHIDDAALAGSTAVEKLVVDHFVKMQGTRLRPVKIPDVEETVRLLAGAYGRRNTRIVADTYQALGMVQRLVDSGFKAIDVPFTAELHNRIATTLYRLLENRALDLPDDPYPIEELSTVRLLRSPLGLKIDHDSGKHNDFSMALGLAAIEALDVQKGRKIKAHSVVRMRSGRTGTSQEQELNAQLRRLAEKGDPVAKDLLRRNGRARAKVRYTALRGRR